MASGEVFEEKQLLLFQNFQENCIPFNRFFIIHRQRTYYEWKRIHSEPMFLVGAIFVGTNFTLLLQFQVFFRSQTSH